VLPGRVGGCSARAEVVARAHQCARSPRRQEWIRAAADARRQAKGGPQLPCRVGPSGSLNRLLTIRRCRRGCVVTAGSRAALAGRRASVSAWAHRLVLPAVGDRCLPASTNHADGVGAHASGDGHDQTPHESVFFDRGQAQRLTSGFADTSGLSFTQARRAFPRMRGHRHRGSLGWCFGSRRLRSSLP